MQYSNPLSIGATLASYRLDDGRGVNWNVRKQVDDEKIRETLLPGLKNFIHPTRENRLIQYPRFDSEYTGVVALSGGIDSTVALYLLASALEDGNSKSKRITAIHCPGFENNDVEAIVEDARKQFPSVTFDYLEMNLKPQIELIAKIVETKQHDLLEGRVNNEQFGPSGFTTRTITSIAHEVAARLGTVAINTTNGTECLIGDYNEGIAFSISPLVNLYKSTVYGVGKALGVPETVLKRQPVNAAFPHRSKLQLYFEKVPETLEPSQAFETLDGALYLLTEAHMEPRDVALRTDHNLEFLTTLRDTVKRNAPRLKNHIFGTEEKTEETEIRFVTPYADVLKEETMQGLLIPNESKFARQVLSDFASGKINDQRIVYCGIRPWGG